MAEEKKKPAAKKAAAKKATAPTPTEPKAVEVTPAETPGPDTASFHGQEYEVTPDQGYRRKK